jgi:hypothetical protein
VSGKDEPMAFAYDYGKGRVFQDLLGHAPQSIRSPGPAELLRRGCVWAARREQLPPEPPPAPVIAPAWLGKALDARKGSATIAADAVFRTLPLTVECWAKLDSSAGFNVLVSNDPKTSANHWEIYTFAQSGAFSAYLPGYGAAVTSDKDVADGQWHYLAMVLEATRVRLYVDGAEVARQDIAKQNTMQPQPGPLAIGRAYVGDQEIGCDGRIDEVRIAGAARSIGGVPKAPFTADAATIGLWHFEDDPRRLRFEDASPRKRSAEFELKLQ